MTKLQRWENETHELAIEFVNKYFGKDTDMYWIAGEVGGCLVINDHFFDIIDIAEYIRNDYSKQMMFKYYDYALKEREKGISPINIKTWKKSKMYK